MSKFDAIWERRSVRKYLPKTVSKDILLEILDAARFAPSAHNAQPWRFIVLTEPESKRRLAVAMARSWLVDLKKDGKPCDLSKFSTDTSVARFVNAPVLVVVCLTVKDMHQFPDEKRQQFEHDLAVQSLGAAVKYVTYGICKAAGFMLVLCTGFFQICGKRSIENSRRCRTSSLDRPWLCCRKTNNSAEATSPKRRFFGRMG